jgi:hypothetical protein
LITLKDPPKFQKLFSDSAQSIKEGKIKPTPLKEIFIEHFGEKEYKKRLDRARSYNKDQDNDIDIDKIMESPVLLLKHAPYGKNDDGEIFFMPEGYFDIDTAEIFEPTGEVKDRFKGNIISLSKMFDITSDTVKNEYLPVVVPHEGYHAQYSESGKSMSEKAPSWLGEEVTPSGNKLTEIHAYGQNIVDLLNRYLPEDKQIDPGSFDNPVAEMPKLADQAKTFLENDIETSPEGRQSILRNHILFIEWARKPFDELLDKKKDIVRNRHKRYMINKLNDAYKSLVSVQDNRFVIQRG